MEVMKKLQCFDSDISTLATNETPRLPELTEADIESASQSTCKDSNPSGCGNPLSSGHGSHSEKILTHTEIWSCDNSSSLDGSERQPILVRRRRLTSIWMPFIAVLFPTVALPAVLIGLVFGFEVDPGTNLFPLLNETTKQPRGYYLVAFSVTRLAIISSCLSTLAPFLTAPILILWRIHTIRSTKRTLSPQSTDRLELNAIPHLTTLLGLLVGSLDDLLKYLLRSGARLVPSRASKKHKSAMSRPIHLAALVVISCIFITLSLWTADTVFHTLSNSANIEKYTTSTLQSHGYHVTPRCQNFDRATNEGLPCTYDLSDNLSLLEFYTRANEIFRVGANVSENSQIQTFAPGLSVLLPQASRVSNRTDYRARTYGVSARCYPVTDICKMETLDVQTYTMFNCSKGFRGVIGEQPVVPTTQNFTILDPDTPSLDFKPSAYLQYGFYQNANLSTPYNSVGYNVSEPEWAVNFGNSSTKASPSDNTLPLTAHMGVAGRFSLSSSMAGVDLSSDHGLFSTTIYSDFIWKCELSAHPIEYVWASGEIRSYTIEPADASLLNMYLGQLPHYTQAAGDDMTDDILQMALQPNSQRMADTWARLFSVRVLSVIAGYTDAGVNLEQQTRVPVLVARVHAGSMWFLVACSLGTALFVSWIALRGLYIVRGDPGICEEAAVLSYAGQLKPHLKKSSSFCGQNSSKKADFDVDDEKGVDGKDDEKDKPAPPERSFTGNSTATTVVPMDTETES